MIRLRPLRPREVRSIRHWAIELAVVVVGVLLALWAAEWADQRREAREREIVERDLREEVRSNVMRWAVRRTMDGCRARDMRVLRDMLVAADDEWPGFREGFAGERDPTTDIELGVISMGQPNYSERAFQRAVNSGHLEKMREQDRLIHRGFHERFQIYNHAMRNMHLHRDRLAFLMYEGPMTPQLRAQALSDLAALNQALRDVIDEGGQMKIALDLLGIELGDELQEALRAGRVSMEERGYYDDCYRVPDLSFTQGMTL